LLSTCKINYEVANPRRVGSLERDKPILKRVDALRHSDFLEPFGFGRLVAASLRSARGPSGRNSGHCFRSENSGGAQHHEGIERFFGTVHRIRGTKALQAIDLVVFYSSEEKRAWK
jgi:hypothetical protein